MSRSGLVAGAGARVDLTLTLGILLAVIVQAAAVLLWAGRASARIDELEARLGAQAPVAERLARLEEQSVSARASLGRIESRLERMEAGR